MTPSTLLLPDRRPDWDLFCRVIDNHGDLGVCWRLAVDLAERGRHVRLWVDDASALSWMAPDGHPGIDLRPWGDPGPMDQPAPFVVEAFGCDPPPTFVARMAALDTPPVWINLEYLSAETYVERSHGLSSPQWSGPGAGLVKWFFYPGFTSRTGGLMTGPPLQAANPGQGPLKMVLFGYRQPALPAWLDALSASTAGPIDLIVTPGWSRRGVEDWLGEALSDGGRLQRGALQVIGQPHVTQAGFDALLQEASVNLVRGEDSLVRALWAGKPLLWQLYPQEDAAHHDKLLAFVDTYLNPEAPPGLREAFEAWNGMRLWRVDDWQRWLQTWTSPDMARWAAQRARALQTSLPDLTTALLAFAQDKRSSHKATVGRS